MRTVAEWAGVASLEGPSGQALRRMLSLAWKPTRTELSADAPEGDGLPGFKPQCRHRLSCVSVCESPDRSVPQFTPLPKGDRGTRPLLFLKVFMK